MTSFQQVLRYGLGNKSFNEFSDSVLSKLCNCHTASMGYHYYKCDNSDCNHIHYQYHGCKNRHCPSCNWQKQEEWQEARLLELLPVKYFHVVFTLPHELNSIIMGNRNILFNQLFKSSSFTLLKLCNDPKWLGGMPSISAVLHTWGQQIMFHPHVHCIVSGGGVDKDLNWVELKKKSEKGYLFPYPVMEAVFKKHFLKNLAQMVRYKEIRLPDKLEWQQLHQQLNEKEWIVYAKSPMGNAGQVVEYLSRYAYKVAISNNRILEVDENGVKFQYKDYFDDNKTKTMILSHKEFVRRFEQHILPKGFVKMRHYGIVGNFNRKKRINAILAKMNLPLHPPFVKTPWHIRLLEKFGTDVFACPKCQKGKLLLSDIVYPHNKGSPSMLLNPTRLGIVLYHVCPLPC